MNSRLQSSYNITLLIILILGILSVLGLLENFYNSLDIIIKENPLPYYYFPIYVLFGLIIPLILRLLKSRNRSWVKPLDQYLIFLSLQIITEILFVLQLGKSSGVIVGFVYSLGRSAQIIFLINQSSNIGIRFFLNGLAILWIANIVQIVINRLLLLLS